jgi:hypothetical protein
MRGTAILLATAWCGCGSPASAPVYGLALHAELQAPTQPTGDLSLTSAQLHLSAVAAVSDRTASDPRAGADSLTLSLGGAADQSWPSPPPGLYSGVTFTVGDGPDDGVDVVVVWRGERVHATVSGGPVDVFCAAPVAVQLGQKAQLSLSVDPSHWFDGLDLASATTDSDDSGVLISDDDNPALAEQLLANVGASFQLVCDPLTR